MSQILFFDGVCSLCNGFVDFLITRDREELFQFAPLQGERASVTLPAELRGSEPDTVVLWTQGQVFTRSDAVLMVLGQLGGGWALARVGWIVPKFLRDGAYRLVASHRYAWFGRRATCRLPTPEERKRFLD